MWVTVKPHAVGRVLREVAPFVKKDHIIVSAAAGVTIKALEKVICRTIVFVKVSVTVSINKTLYIACFVFTEQEENSNTLSMVSFSCTSLLSE